MSSAQARIKFTFDQPVTIYALVMGGWYPLAFAPNCVIALDRNTLGVLHQLDDPSRRQDAEANKWWLKFINNESFTLNPVLCALEGQNRISPSKEEFIYLFESAKERINRYLPKAKIIEYSNAHFDAAFEMLHHLSERYEVECRFLTSVVPLIAHRRRDSELREIHEEILRNCETLGLSKNSLIVIAVLSCLYERKNGLEPLIGRNIIKPSTSYSNGDAHNAISDLRALEMLAATNALNIGCASFCTRDRYLVAMWCGIKLTEPRWSGNQFTCNISPNNTVFPRLNNGQIYELVNEICSTNQ